MEGLNNAFYCLDYSPKEFERGFGPWIQKQYELYYKYYSTVRQAVRADLGEYTPKRIGHFDLIKKYQHHFGFEQSLGSPQCAGGERYLAYHARTRARTRL